MGPAFRAGALLNLDLVVFDDVPVPGGAWGLGPELPRRIPFFLPIAWASSVLDGHRVVALLLVACIAAAVAGAARLARGAPLGVRIGAGCLYGLSPFLLTRAAVGHLPVVAAMAILAWAFPVLARPGRDRPKTFLWLAALAVTGVYGGMLAVPTVVVGLCFTRLRRLWSVLGLLVLSQLIWIVPGAAVVLAGGARLDNSASFTTQVGGSWGVFRLFAGQGFFRVSNQVGGDLGLPAAAIGALLLFLAAVGAGGLPSRWRRQAATLAAIGLLAALGSVVPLWRDVYEWATSSWAGAPFREGQRLLVLTILWLAPSAALGAETLARSADGMIARLARAIPLALAVLLAAPALWGIGGQLQPVAVPDDWSAARSAIAREPGTVVVLPWEQYFVADVADGRKILNPMPAYLGGDVLSSSDPGTGSVAYAPSDPRERAMTPLVRALLDDRPAAQDLSGLGVRWVVLLKELNFADYDLADDPGLDEVLDGPALGLYRVRDWPGPAVDRSGAAVAVDGVVAPVARVGGASDASSGGSGPALVWFHPGAKGWLRGTERAEVTPTGLLRVPGGGGPLWYWPAALVLAADLAALGAVAAAIFLVFRRRSAP